MADPLIEKVIKMCDTAKSHEFQEKQEKLTSSFKIYEC